MQTIVKSTQLIAKKLNLYAIINSGDNMENCVFCKIAKKEIESKELYQDDFVIAIMDINPKSLGHTLIITKEHYTDYTEVPAEVLAHINRVAKRLGDALMEKLEATGMTMSVNYGSAQEVKHYHMHLLPQGSKHKGKYSVEDAFKLLTTKKED